MRNLTTLSARMRIVVAATATLAGAGALAVPSAYASAATQPKAPHAAASASSCTNRTEAHTDNNHEVLTLWYTKLPNHVICIGTIKTTSYPPKGTCVNPQVRIYSGNFRLKAVWLNPDGKKHWVCNDSTVKTHFWPSPPSHTVWTSGSVQVVGSAEIRGGRGELGPASITLKN